MNQRTDERPPVERLVETASEWPGVTLGPHPYDGVAFLLGEYEFGHAHRGWESLHVNYPRRMKAALLEAGRADEHSHFPNTGWTERAVGDPADLEDALGLLRLSYLYRALTRRRNPAGQAALEEADVDAELDELDADERVRDVFADVRRVDA